MMNRREVLLGAAAAALGAASAFAMAPLLPVEDAGDKAAEDRLRADLARLAPRVNSEEGVPVFLACVNLVDHKAVASLTPLNGAVAAEFRRDATAWERIKPNAPATDVANLIQVLAYRDFAVGGTTQP